MLTTILIGNNLVNIAASVMATVLATRWFGHAGPGIAVGVLTVVPDVPPGLIPSERRFVAARSGADRVEHPDAGHRLPAIALWMQSHRLPKRGQSPSRMTRTLAPSHEKLPKEVIS